jgi:hypothetical protein
LITRTFVGLIGIVLPIALMTGENYFNGSVHARGSLSAYFHSPMRDLFVGGLGVVGVLLLTYMSGQWQTVDFVFSCIAGIAVLGVAFLPTTRPELPKDAVRCGPHTIPEPPGCSSLESAWDEIQVARMHAVCASVFILALAAICGAFAYRERRAKPTGIWWKFYLASALLIVLAVIWVFVGVDIFALKPLYVGEVVSVWSFGASWFAKGDGLRTLLLRPIPPP